MQYRAKLVELLLLAYSYLLLAYVHLPLICFDCFVGEDSYYHCGDGAYARND